MLIALALLVVCVGGVIRLRPVEVGLAMTDLAVWHAGVASGYTSVGGHRIHYFEAKPRGSGQHAVPVVLLHGLGARAEDWMRLMPLMSSRGYHVYAPDLLGYGRSEQPSDASFSLSEEEQVVRGFLDAQGIKQADVAGWSLGGWIALKLALDWPERVRRVVGMDAAGIYFVPPIPLSDFAPHNSAELGELVNALEPHDRSIPPWVARDVLRRMRHNGWVIERGEQSMMDGRELLDFRLADMQRPVMYVWGGADRLIPPAIGERMHALTPGSEFVEVPKCGHLAPHECARQVLEPMDAFLSKP
jgi:pimeloyl-ACP methyl ester carboxylesterase